MSQSQGTPYFLSPKGRGCNNFRLAKLNGYTNELMNGHTPIR